MNRTPLAIVLLSAWCAGQQTMLANLEPLPFAGGGGESVTSFTVSGGTAAYQISANLHLAWVTDGTVAGTRPMTGISRNTINEGSGGFQPFGPDRFAASASLDGLGRELILYDAVNHSVQLVADIAPGPDDGVKSGLVVDNGTIYFGADDGSGGTQLWSSDGTAASTASITSANFQTIRQLAVANGLIYFQGRTQNGYEPFRSDGTPQGTFALQSPGGTSLFYEEMRVAPFAGGALLTINGQPCYTDGTSVTVLGQAQWSEPREYTEIGNGTALFVVDAAGSTELLVRTDGTAAGTSSVALPTQSGSRIDGLARIGNAAVFAFAAMGAESHPWISDGTASGTQQLAATRLPNGAGDRRFERVGNELWFPGRLPASGEELYATDGTPAGTRLVLDYFEGTLSSAPRAVTAFGNGVLCSAQTQGRRALVFTDGSAAGTRTLASLEATSGSSLPAEFARAGSSVVFRASQLSSGIGQELYVTDGTPAGTGLLVDLTPASPFGGASPNQIVSLGARAVFSANVGSAQLYATDGTVGGTVPLGASEPEGITGFGGRAVFAADTAGGYEPWVTDGTAAGTAVLLDLNPGGGSNPGDFTRFGSQVLFSAFDIAAGREPWITDGTAAGTLRLADALPGASASFPRDFAADTQRGWFVADDGLGQELWTTDGTAAGTMRVVDLLPGASGSLPQDLVASNGLVWFTASDGSARALWVSDGTAGGTMQLMARPDGQDLEVTGAAPLGGGVCFLADDGTGAGVCLFVSDGTVVGTQRLLDIGPAAYGGFAEGSLTAVPGASLVTFVADDLEHGLQLWISNGTPAGTMVFSSIGTPGVGAFGIDQLTADGHAVFARVHELVTGHEPWLFEASAMPLAFDVEVGQPCGSTQPVIGGAGLPVLGDPSYGITLDGVDVPTAAFLFYSDRLARFFLGNCEVFLAPPLHAYTMVSVAPGVTATASLPLPNDPAVAGANLFWQWAVLHPSPAALDLFQLSGGLQTHIGF